MTREEEVAFGLGRAEAVFDVRMLIIGLVKEIKTDDDADIVPFREQIMATLMALDATIVKSIK